MSDLRPVHTVAPIDPGNRGKITVGVMMTLAILLVGGYTYAQGDWHFGSNIAVSDSRLPQPSLPLNAPKG